MFGAKPVEIVSWGEGYTVKIVDGWGDRVDFDIYRAGPGDPAYAMGQRVDKVRVVDGWGERPSLDHASGLKNCAVAVA